MLLDKKPMLRRISVLLTLTRRSKIVALPESADKNPMRIFMVVDLPAPLGPRKPVMEPDLTSKLTPDRAGLLLKLLASLLVFIVVMVRL